MFKFTIFVTILASETNGSFRGIKAGSCDLEPCL